jgi:hypothetical protein
MSYQIILNPTNYILLLKVYNGGESGIEDAGNALFDSTMAQLAERLGGIFVYMEHRYYGESTPKNADFVRL